jgi:hypothetical protein
MLLGGISVVEHSTERDAEQNATIALPNVRILTQSPAAKVVIAVYDRLNRRCATNIMIQIPSMPRLETRQAATIKPPPTTASKGFS